MPLQQPPLQRFGTVVGGGIERGDIVVVVVAGGAAVAGDLMSVAAHLGTTKDSEKLLSLLPTLALLLPSFSPIASTVVVVVAAGGQG